MKVLFLDHPEADFLAAQLYFGLCQELGPENVVDYPYKGSYHGEVHRYLSPYATDPGTSAWSSWRVGDDGPEGMTPPFEWLPGTPGLSWDQDDVEEALRERVFDLIVLASPRAYNGIALEKLIVAVGRENLPKIVMVDGEDYDAIRWDLVEKFAPAVYFKRELVPTPGDIYPAQRQRWETRVPVKPFPLAPVVLRSVVRPASMDVVMLGGDNCPGGKAPYEDAVRAVAGTFVSGRFPFYQFLDVVQDARIAVALRGHSQDSLRSWEMLACAGPMVAVHKHNLIRHEPFVDGKHVVLFDGPDELKALLRKYLADEPARRTIAAAGHAHLKEHHTARARARYLLRESA